MTLSASSEENRRHFASVRALANMIESDLRAKGNFHDSDRSHE
jgi:hypothetical protein